MALHTRFNMTLLLLYELDGNSERTCLMAQSMQYLTAGGKIGLAFLGFGQLQIQ